MASWADLTARGSTNNQTLETQPAIIPSSSNLTLWRRLSSGRDKKQVQTTVSRSGEAYVLYIMLPQYTPRLKVSLNLINGFYMKLDTQVINLS